MELRLGQPLDGRPAAQQDEQRKAKKERGTVRRAVKLRKWLKESIHNATHVCTATSCF
jgi:hypothetical protein